MVLALACTESCLHRAPYQLDQQDTLVFLMLSHTLLLQDLRGREKWITSRNSQWVHRVYYVCNNQHMFYIECPIYIHTHIYINFYRYSEREASIMCKDYFPICPSESTQSNGINKADVLKCQTGSALERLPRSSCPWFYTHCASHICVHIHRADGRVTTWHDSGKSEILSPESLT